MAYQITDKCTGCGNCVGHCSTGALNSSLDDNRQSFIIDTDLCVDCGHCTNFCDIGAIADSKGNIVLPVPREERAVPIFDYDKCTGCMLCVESCPEFALVMIKLDRLDSVAALNCPDKCLGCGFCSRNCPVRAISMVKRKDINAPG